jgi:hypothetical protein
MTLDHTSRAREAWPILVERVQARDDSFTYGALANRLGYHRRAAHHFLAIIQNWCLAHGWPNLTALVVDAVRSFLAVATPAMGIRTASNAS